MAATAEVLSLPLSVEVMRSLQATDTEGSASLYDDYASYTAQSYGRAVLSLVEAESHDCAQAPQWFNSDDIPALRLARVQAEEEHDTIFEYRMASVREGDVTTVPIEVDPITAGDMVNEARRLYGEGSWQYREKRAGLVLNGHRFLGETTSKNGPEYFDYLWQPYSPEEEDYISYGTPTSLVTKNGITPLAEQHEIPRRKYDHIETVVNRELGKGIGRLALHAAEVSLDSNVELNVECAFLPAELRESEVVSSIVICELPTAIKRRWLEDKSKGIQRSYGGYAPQDDKYMIRRTRYVKGAEGRDFEQVALSGKYHTHDIIQKFWAAQKVLSQEQAARVSQDEAQSVRVVTAGDISAVQVTQLIDDIASEVHGKNIFLGEEVPADHLKDYDAFPDEAAARQAKLEAAAEKLADYVEELSRQGVDHFLANGYYEKYAKKLMLELAKDDIELAVRTFDVETAAKYNAAHVERASGNHLLADRLVLEAEASAPPLEGCGAGSCDLDAVPEQSAEAAMADRAGLKGEKLLFKKSTCINCPKEGTVMFDKHGNMFCTYCHASKVDGVIKNGKKEAKSILLPLTDVSKPKLKVVASP